MIRGLVPRVVSLLALFGGLLVGITSPASAATAAPLKIALITSVTGLAAPLFSHAPQGFLARIALQNARGGVNGHKLVPIVINDQTNPSQVSTAVQEAISDGVIGIVNDSSLFYAGFKYAYQAGIPVTGGSFDGPEWGTQPYTNMFASDTGSVNPRYPATTLIGNFLKSHGGTVLGTYGISISPSSTQSAKGVAISFQRAGGKVGVLDTSVVYGSVDFTAASLVAKSKGVNAVYAGMGNNQNYAIATTFEQAGVKFKAVVFPTGYEADIIHSNIWRAVQGMYFSSEFRPTALPNAGTRQMLAALQKYQGRKPANFPTFDVYESWLGADLMIAGLQRAGANPTHASVIKALRGIKAYNGNGILPQSYDYSTNFGTDAPQCSWFMRAAPNGFVAVSVNAICGHDIPGTATAEGS